MSETASVAVIGAGVAGLCAARALAHAGRSVVLLEARPRAGGRILTIPDSKTGVPIELGAEFVHGRPPEICRLVERGVLRAHEVEGEYLSAIETPRNNWEEVEALMQRLDSAPEQSFLEFIESIGVDEAVRAGAIGYVEGFNAARAEWISVRGLAHQNAAARAIREDHLYRVEGGYGMLVNWLERELDPASVSVHFETVAQAVRWRRGHVEIDALRRGDAVVFHAERVVVTAPLAVLQAGAIRFEPEPVVLPDALAAIEMGPAARITFRFRRPLWHDVERLRGFGFLQSDEPWMPVWWNAAPDVPVITGWTGGSKAEPGAHLEPAEWRESALASLARILGMPLAAVEGELESWHAHNWSSDPFSRGAYSYVKVGGLEAQKRFGEPVEETLYFAGEATNAEGHIGTVHGAMAAGERAAALIMASEAE